MATSALDDFTNADALGDVCTRSPGNTEELPAACPPLTWTGPVLIRIAPSVLAINRHVGTISDTTSTAFLSIRILTGPPFIVSLHKISVNLKLAIILTIYNC